MTPSSTGCGCLTNSHRLWKVEAAYTFVGVQPHSQWFLTPPTWAEKSEKEYSDLTASNSPPLIITPTTSPKVYLEGPGDLLRLRPGNMRRYSLAYFQDFSKISWRAKNWSGFLQPRQKTALGINQLRFNYLAKSCFMACGVHFLYGCWGDKRRDSLKAVFWPNSHLLTAHVFLEPRY